MPFRDGTGRLRNNLDEIYVNLFLVHSGLRPAFLIQPSDYADADRNTVGAAVRSAIDTRFEDNTFALRPIDQGMLVVDSNRLEEIAPLVTQYRDTAPADPESDRLLGEILGYPAAGDTMSFTAWGRVVHHIETPDGGDVMSNITTSQASNDRFVARAQTFRAAVRALLNIELTITHQRLM